MSLKTAAIVAVGLVAAVTGSVGITSYLLSDGPAMPICIDVLKAEANKVEQKMAMPNSDGGLYLLTQGNKTDRVNFLGYVGPKSVEKVQPMMIENGLLNVSVKTVGQCETEGGLIYTLVSGHYDVPEQKPDPI